MDDEQKIFLHFNKEKALSQIKKGKEIDIIVVGMDAIGSPDIISAMHNSDGPVLLVQNELSHTPSTEASWRSRWTEPVELPPIIIAKSGKELRRERRKQNRKNKK